MNSTEDIMGRLQREKSLEATDISSLVLDRIDIAEVRFEACHARNSRYAGGDLSHSSWVDCRLAACELASVKLKGAAFIRCRFADPDASAGSTFRFCELEGARFEDCDLSLALFQHCD
jgi:uncharacterized protein YjbI with pentapeptide repeats